MPSQPSLEQKQYKCFNFCLKLLLIFICTVFLAQPVFAHPGRTAADGCHYCRTNCDKWGVPWNERHCHGSTLTPPATTTPTPKTYEFNGKVYTSFTDYQNAKDEYEKQQAEIKRLEEEKANLQKELEKKQPETQGTVKGEETTVNKENQNTNIVKEAKTVENINTNIASTGTTENDNTGGTIATIIILAVLGGGAYYLIKRLKKKNYNQTKT